MTAISDTADLVQILDLEQFEHNLFRGRVPQVGWTRVYGGLVVAQSLAAACRTVEGLQPHSLHCYFLLGGDPSIPIVYDVDRIRDGGSFATRRVVAIQHGRAIFAISISFHRKEEGYAHHAAMPDVPMPWDLPDPRAMTAQSHPELPDSVRRYFARERPFEFRPVDYARYSGGGRKQKPEGYFWLRAAKPLPDDQALHRCALAYASDMTLLDVALGPHGASVFSPEMMVASLDHALWFHRDVNAGDWFLYAQDSPNAGEARGFSRGQIFTTDGVLVASVAQEGLIRRRRADPGNALKKAMSPKD